MPTENAYKYTSYFEALEEKVPSALTLSSAANGLHVVENKFEETELWSRVIY